MSIARKFHELTRSSDGSVLVFVGIALAAFLGFAALAFDFGRIASTQSELQSFADNVAIAAAGELDGRPDAMIRATTAVANLISDRQTFGAGGNELGEADYALSFYASLPADDQDPLATPLGASAAASAVYARAVVDQREVDTGFGAAFASLTGSARLNSAVGAEAVAGTVMYACHVTSMAFCLPNPGWRANDHVGEMILLRSGSSGGSSWGPGDFGFVDLSAGVDEGPCDGLTGHNLSRCMIGAEDVLTRCLEQRGIDLQPGQSTGSYEAAVNVRFDLYGATMNGKRNDADYRPAPSVIKGVVPNSGQCIGNNPVDSPSEPLPEDTCFATGTCPHPQFGDGDWDRDAYVTANHGTDPSTGAPDYPAGTGPDSTRYAMYLAELAAANGVAAPAEFAGANPVFAGQSYDTYRAALIATDSANAVISGSESGRPTCSMHRSPDPERRVVVAAGIDCSANAVQGAATDVPVIEFVKLFLTKPAGVDPADSSQFNMWAEILGSVRAPGTSHDVVQLYR